ncbi:MFS transporter [Paraoerskovia sediminicola]|uniref:MFS transporter n=1 Tax=Paraoerskovia sediminicola TaxID=1138587 RepID=A0ABM8G142_9CELL|nr:MFS transporter [Paraoerskovia sediminicola]BDZ41791.1 MFS transporter [Paraoerskovia sediminicola]
MSAPATGRAAPAAPKFRMPPQVWLLTLAAFAIGTAEFVVAGILTDVAGSLGVTEGRAGYLITVYAAAIVVGGPVLTLWLARFDKRRVLVGLLLLFVAGNLVAAFTDSYPVLLVARTVTGLVQGPFYGIGAVVATSLVPTSKAGRAVGQMFAGLTLANVLGVPAGSWIGERWGWNASFLVVAAIGAVAAVAIAVVIRVPQAVRTPDAGAGPATSATTSVRGQLAALRDPQLLMGLAITVLGWLGFMTFYGYVAPVAEQVAGIDRSLLTGVLVVIGAGLVLGNVLGGRSADANLARSMLGWPIAMSLSLVVVGLVAASPWLFVVAAFVFGVTSFANVPPMQMRVMQQGTAAPELVATLNISAFNLANAAGGLIGGVVVDSALGAGALPFVAAALPVLGIALVLVDRRRRVG